MANLTQVEFNTIRELVGPAMVSKEKYSAFAQQAQDQQVKQLLQQMSSSCEQKVSTLLNFM